MEQILNVVGKSHPLVDAWEKVTGQAEYVSDVKLPRMLFGRILRSPYPHARIHGIDTSLAEREPGVKAVITAKDTAKVKMLEGAGRRDKMALEAEKVRFIGDEVAAVAAVDEQTAEKALGLIKVDYEVLLPIFTIEDALKEDAPSIHEEYEGNICHSMTWTHGDVEEGFREADVIVEDQYVAYNRQHHAPMGPVSCLASWSKDEELTLWATAQRPHLLRKELADAMQISPSKIRIRKAHIGGGFGGRTGMLPIFAITAYLAKKTGSPVMTVFSREEEFIGTANRAAILTKIKTGVRKDGKITACDVKVFFDKGAYVGRGVVIGGVIGWAMMNLYKIPNRSYQAEIIYTNNPYSTSFRGFGNPQFTAALESHLDTVAEKIGVDPLELRLKNVYEDGDITPTGTRLEKSNLGECIKGAAELIGWHEKRIKKTPLRGVGVACFAHCSGWRGAVGNVDMASAIVRINHDGSAHVACGVADSGQGADTILALVAAEALGLTPDRVRVTSYDTELTPIDFGCYADRTTFIAGNAVRLAAEDARNKLLEVAGEMLDAQPKNLELENSVISVRGDGTRSATIQAVANHAYFSKGNVIIGQASYDTDTTLMDYKTGVAAPPGPVADALYGAQAVEVEVDPDTGRVKLLTVAAVHDVGLALNRMYAEGQVEGGIAQGIGMALREQLIVNEGKIQNPYFTDYKILNSMDSPEVLIDFIEKRDSKGPWGAKGVGEPSAVGIPAALTNAIYNAVGVRVKELPITPEALLNAMRKLNNPAAT